MMRRSSVVKQVESYFKGPEFDPGMKPFCFIAPRFTVTNCKKTRRYTGRMSAVRRNHSVTRGSKV